MKTNDKKLLKCVLIFAILLFLGGCSQQEYVTVSLQDAAKNMKINEAEFSLYKCDFCRLENGIAIEDDFQDFNQNFCLAYQKNEFVPVYIKAYLKDDIVNKTGFLYPITNDFSIHGAFCAYIYLRLFTNSFENVSDTKKFCSYFNWQKFYQKVLTYDDPFLLDSDKLCGDIASGKCNSYSFKIKSEEK